MDPNIIISGTSFLLPKNEAWNILGSANKIIFPNYGDWRSSIKMCKKNEYLVFVIFISDLYGISSETHNKRGKAVLDLIKVFLKTIEQHLKKSSSPTIVTFSSWRSESIIRVAGNKNYSEKIYNILTKSLNGLKASYSNLYSFDLDKQLGYHGFAKAFDNRNWYLTRCHLSINGLNTLAQSLAKIIERIKSPPKKVLVLDCDNTLWGGVVGEDGISGITLGQDGLGSAFVDFQYIIKKLNQEGVLLALCSKNNEEDVWEVFQKHQSMILKKNNIAAYKINWKDKVENLIELSSELDLDLSSFVFWDDNLIERDRIRKAIPQVLAVEPSKNVTEWPEHLSGMNCFAKFNITNEDKKKTKQYRIRAKFTKDIKTEIDEVSFLKSIKLKAEAIPIDESTIKRASQLSMKTNQFNLRTVRYAESEIEKSHKNKNSFLVNLNDVYGDHGLVGLVCAKTIDTKFIFLENFLMSCRVLGRHLEAWMFNKIVQNARKHNYEYILAEYIPTKKNVIVKKCLDENGFELVTNYNNQNLKKINLRNYVKNGKVYIASVKKIKIPFVEVYE